ncbi:MAG: hypothetical protein Q7R52_02525 [archaeon]|nr:hypothetical protein [archaeon]
MKTQTVRLNVETMKKVESLKNILSKKDDFKWITNISNNSVIDYALKEVIETENEHGD